MENQPSKISVRMESRVNLGGYNNYVSLALWIEDYVRETDKTTGAAFDRVHGLVEAKLAEKLEPYQALSEPSNE